MRKLFRAAFYRTENKKMIRIELVIAVLLSAFIILNGYFQTNLTNAYIYKLVARFFGYSPLMGPFMPYLPHICGEQTMNMELCAIN